MEAVIFIGIQASGKSTFYKNNFFKTHVRINLDMLKTRHREKLLFEACLNAKQSFVIDNTNPTVEDRQRYIPLSKNAGFKVIGFHFDTIIDQALIRNSLRIGKENIPSKGIYRTLGKLTIPRFDEGFDMIYRVVIENNKFIISENNK